MIFKDDFVYKVLDVLVGSSLSLYEACCDAGADDMCLSEEQLALLDETVERCMDCGEWMLMERSAIDGVEWVSLKLICDGCDARRTQS